MKISKPGLRQVFHLKAKLQASDFWNLFDSFQHKDDKIEIGSIDNLQNALDNKLDSDVQITLLEAFDNAVEASVSGIVGEALPDSSPTNYDPATYPDGLYEKYDVNTPGIYTNFLNASGQPLQITSDDLKGALVYIAVKNGVAKKNRTKVSVTVTDVNFAELTEYVWNGNNTLNLSANTFILVNKNVANGYLLVTQDATGGRTLTVEGKLLDINPNPNAKSLIGYVLVGTQLVFSVNKNLTDTVVLIPDTEAPTAPALNYSGVTGNSVNLSWTGATDNVAVVGYDIYKNNVFLVNTPSNNYTVGSLSPTTAYEFKVKAKDASGNASEFSNTVAVTTNNSIIPVFANGGTGFTTVSPGVYRHITGTTGAVSNEKLIADGYIEFGANITGDMCFGLDSDNTVENFGGAGNCLYECFVDIANSQGKIYTNYKNQPVSSLNDLGSKTGIVKMRLSRTGTTVKLQKSTDGATFTDVYTFPNAISGELWIKLSSVSLLPAQTESLILVNL